MTISLITDTYVRAAAAAKLAEEHSEVETDSNNEGRRKRLVTLKRKTTEVVPQNFLESESETETESEKAAKQPKLRTIVPPADNLLSGN